MKSINSNAPVKCSKSILIKASQDQVWAVLTEIDNWPNWQVDIPKAKLNGALKPNTTFDWKTGGAQIHSTIHTIEKTQFFGWTGKTFGIYAIHNWTLTSVSNGTLVRVDESMEGFLALIFKSAFNKNLSSGMQNWLELLKKECESKK